MATYAIGDIHGCYDQLQALLTKINFDATQDTLWFTGDLINCGPKSVEVLRFIKSLGDKCICVLGNHDIALLGIAAGVIPVPNDRPIGVQPVLDAVDCAELIEWLRMQPLVHYDRKFNVLLVHAGVLPNWNLQQVLEFAQEVESVLHGPQALELYRNLYGDLPDRWNADLSEWDRLRFIINCFTRMRFCNAQGELNLSTKGDIHSAPIGYSPWFEIPNRILKNQKIIFGHWAALLGNSGDVNALAIDTGCVWGYELTALRLDDWQRFSVKA